jgi:hypothetical protein
MEESMGHNTSTKMAELKDWSGLNNLQIGKYAEYFTKMEFTSYGFEVFTSEVDDRGVDFIIKDKKGNFLEMQVKSTRNLNYIYALKDKFNINNLHLYMVLVLFGDEKMPELYVIPAKTWQNLNSLFVSRDYEKPGQKSSPEWGINLSEKNLEILCDYKFEKKIKDLL